MEKENVNQKGVKNEVVNCEFVDLGLSVKWGNMNVGAKKVNENGEYFAWNEVNCDEGRLPSEDEIKELIEKCIWEWVCIDGVKGYMVKSKENSMSQIFLPAAGVMCEDRLYYVGEMGYYLSSTIRENSVGACELIMSSKYYGMYLAGSYKRTVRLVLDK